MMSSMAGAGSTDKFKCSCILLSSTENSAYLLTQLYEAEALHVRHHAKGLHVELDIFSAISALMQIQRVLAYHAGVCGQGRCVCRCSAAAACQVRLRGGLRGHLAAGQPWLSQRQPGLPQLLPVHAPAQDLHEGHPAPSIYLARAGGLLTSPPGKHVAVAVQNIRMQ